MKKFKIFAVTSSLALSFVFMSFNNGNEEALYGASADVITIENGLASVDESPQWIVGAAKAVGKSAVKVGKSAYRAGKAVVTATDDVGKVAIQVTPVATMFVVNVAHLKAARKRQGRPTLVAQKSYFQQYKKRKIQSLG